MSRPTFRPSLFAYVPLGYCILVNSPMAAEPPVPAAAMRRPVFDQESFWYAPIPEHVSLNPDSGQLVQAFLRQKALGKKDLVGINTSSFSSPIYIVNKDAPTVAVKVIQTPEMGHAPFDKLSDQFRAVPIPSFAEPAGGDDSEMSIWQPSTDTLWEFWRAQKINGQWQACWGGRLDNVSRSNGIWPNPFGASATGLPFAGGQITAEELAAGEINHVIGIALKKADQRFTWPASRSDGNECDAGPCIREGQRFRLDPSVDIDKLDLHRVGKIIARAAQKYGFVVWDIADTTSLRAKNPSSYRPGQLEDPYPKLFDPKDQWTVLDGFPWDKIQFLPLDYGGLSDAELEKSARIRALLERWVSPAGPGAAVMVIQNHRILHRRGYGLARLSTTESTSITPSTNFRLASVTKQFTGMAMAMVMKDFSISLDDPLTKIFPDHPAKQIKIRHLLHHTSGLRHYDTEFRELGMVDDVEYRAWRDRPVSPFEPNNDDLHNLLKTRTLLDFAPGRFFVYNNTGYAYLASIISRCSQKNYADFLHDRIFSKLGMTTTYTGNGRKPDIARADFPNDMDPNLANSYDFAGIGTGTDIDYSPFNNIRGPDGVFSNLDDLYKWDQALYPKAVQVPGAPMLASDDTLRTILASEKTLNDVDTHYGFGWFVDDDGHRVEHDGVWAGYRTYIRRYPCLQFTIIVLANSATIDASAIVAQIDDIYYGDRRPIPQPFRSAALRVGQVPLITPSRR